MATPRRLAAFPYVGFHRYFLTICTEQRAERFTKDEDVELVHAHILTTSTQEQFEVTAYCYMPDHWHALVTGLSEDARLRPYVSRAKQRSGWHFSRARRRKLWQPGYYDRVLRDEETTPEVIEYIVNNPVRAGIVKRPIEYPYWGSTRFSREQLLEFIGSSSRWRP